MSRLQESQQGLRHVCRCSQDYTGYFEEWCKAGYRLSELEQSYVGVLDLRNVAPSCLRWAIRCDRALWHWTVRDRNGKEKRLIDLVKFDEVYDGKSVPFGDIKPVPETAHAADVTTHFRRIKGWTNFEYSDMVSLTMTFKWSPALTCRPQILYDDDAINNNVEMTLGAYPQLAFYP